MNPPLVSVIIAVKNGERYLRTAIESVRATGYERREIIVVDGKSIDNTPSIVRSFEEVRLIEQEGQGLCDAWNLGIAAAEGDLLAFLDSDDLWSKDKLNLQVTYMNEHPEIEYSIGRVEFFLEPGFSVPSGFRKELLGKDHIGRIPGTLLARRKLFDTVGMFNTEFVLAGDVDWFTRAKDREAPLAILDDILLYKRVHDRNLNNSDIRLNTAELLEIFKRSVSRQRKN